MSSVDDIERRIADLHLTTRAETDRRILDDAYTALGKTVQRQQPATGAGVWSVFIRNRYTVPAAIAASILLVFYLFVSIRSNGAVSAEKIYAALSQVENIHISTYRANQTSPDRQVWASESLGVKLFKTELGNQAQYTLWDMKNRIKMVKFLSSNSIQTEPITQQMVAELEKSAVGSADMLPFSDRNDIPDEAQWVHIEDGEVSVAVAGTRAYELNWIDKSTDSQAVLHRKWRVFAEDRTRLPKRIEWYSKTGSEDEYGFEKYAVIAYPSEDEIRDIIKEIFGRQDDPEFIGTPGAYR
jgi:hypothetical protein